MSNLSLFGQSQSGKDQHFLEKFYRSSGKDEKKGMKLTLKDNPKGSNFTL
jgi:hypothetical protein